MKNLTLILIWLSIWWVVTAHAAPMYSDWQLWREYGRLESKYNAIIGEDLPRLEKLLEETWAIKKEKERIWGIAKCKMQVIEKEKRFANENECLWK